jgi:hypothetical protein
MALNTTRTAPQKSFGRRPGPGPQSSTPQPAAPPPVTDVLKDAQPASNWLSEIAGQSRPAAPPATAPVAVDRFTDAPAASLDAFHVIGRGLKVMGKNPVTFLAVLAAIALPEQFVAYLPVSLGAPAAMIGPVFTTLGCMALYIAAFHGALAGLKGETVNLDDCLRALARTPVSAYGAIAMTVSFLSLMLIVPAIGFAGRWALAAPVAIVEGGDARARSVALTASHRAQLRLLVLILAGLTLLSALLAMSLSPGAMVSALAGDWLFPMLLTMFAAVAGAVLYRELVPAGAAATA